MPVRDVREAGLAEALVLLPLRRSRSMEEARLHIRVHIIGHPFRATGRAERAPSAVAALGFCQRRVRERFVRAGGAADATTTAGGLRTRDGAFFVRRRGVRHTAAGEVALHFGGFGEGTHDVLHMVRLTADEGAEVDDDALGFVTLT